MTVADQILWHVEQVCGPLSRQTSVAPGDSDFDILLHNISAIVGPICEQARQTQDAFDAGYRAAGGTIHPLGVVLAAAVPTRDSVTVTRRAETSSGLGS